MQLFFFCFLLFSFVEAGYKCSQHAKLTIVESIPVQLNLPTKNDTWHAWRYLAQKATRTLDIAAYYVRLTGGMKYPPIAQGIQGDLFFKDVLNAIKRGVKVRLVQNKPSAQFPDLDSQKWAAAGAEVRSIDWASLMPNNDGILHTKMIIVDDDDFYLGSANMDWAALTEVKELGVVVEDCELLAQDALKIHKMYWEAAHYQKLPAYWPHRFDTIYNRSHPADAVLNGENIKMFLSASPDQFDTPNRAHDGDTIVDNINRAQSTVCVEVMDYYPYSAFSNPNFWYSKIDNALRQAAWRGVKVRLMFSLWKYSDPAEIPYWKSLAELDNIDLRVFRVPPLNGTVPIPYTRVNHAKYLVTDSVAYIGTSNWSGDYFVNTAGLGWTIESKMVTAHVQALFDRDWNSPYATNLLTLSDKELKAIFEEAKKVQN